MNEEAKAELDRILALSPEEVTESERAFLQARRSYMTEDQRNVFGVTDTLSKPETASDAHVADAGVEAVEPASPAPSSVRRVRRA
jgi:hypothetical protein